MKKTFAGLGVLALIALGATGASFPANALEVQPVAEIVAESDAIVASPDAVLSQSEPVVVTTPAEVPAEPVAVVAEPVEAPVAPAQPVVVPEPVAVVADAPVTPEPVAVAPTGQPVYAEDGSLISDPNYAYSQEQLDIINLNAHTRVECFALGYIMPQDANSPHREGYTYTPSLVDPSKVCVKATDEPVVATPEAAETVAS